MKDIRMLYAGTFDPITNGHLDIIQRGAKLGGELIIGVLNNLSKKPFFSVEKRIEMIAAATKDLSNIQIVSFEGLLAEYVNSNGINVVLRGLRATTDFEYEIQMAQMNAGLYIAGVETVFLMTHPAHSFISSSIVKEVFFLGGDISGLVPPVALDMMKKHREIR